MACLIAPATVAIITTVSKRKIPEKYHVEWLILMLWGGTTMLLVDHIISGEIIPYYPFSPPDSLKYIEKYLLSAYR
jgi:hypothetical protein